MSEDFRSRAVLIQHGHLFEDFFEGQEFCHHWGRTIFESDAVLFSTLTLNYNPLYFNADYARRHDHPDIVVAPMLVFNVVLGLSVEDLSEIGGPFLGIDDLRFHAPVYPRDTITASSMTLAKRVTTGDAGTGIVTWQTFGRNQHGEDILSFRRSNLIRLRAADARP